MLDVVSARRSAEDILSGVVRVTLGGQTYELPVRSIRANRDWKTQLNDRLGGFLQHLDDTDDLQGVLALIATQVDDLLDVLCSYDSHGILPSRDEIEAIEPDVSMEVVTAVREVWRAANPLVVRSLARLAETPAEPSSPPTSSPPMNITGRRRKSRTG